MHLVFDMDFVIFEAVSVVEDRFITATHIPTNTVMEFKNKTELWGKKRTRDGGWIESSNKALGTIKWKAEDFEIVEGHRLRDFKIKEGGNKYSERTGYYTAPWEGAKKILDDKINLIVKTLGATSYSGFTGTGNVFRHDLCTLLYYKDRDELLRPFLLDQMKKYVCEHHNCELVTRIEADDACTMAVLDGYNKWVKGGKKDSDIVIGIAIDKDSKQTSGWHYNPNKDSTPRLIEGFGKLWLTEKGEVDGEGRMWLYYQMFGDSADNYKANCFSDVKWADKSGYNALCDCKNDKQAWEALVKSFKLMYPEKKMVEGCKGPVEIDWLCVLQEMANMAFMLRKPNDKLAVVDVLTKLGVDYA